MRKVIAMTLSNRPKYTKQTFASLSKCVGIEDYLILPSIEPMSEEVIELARGINFAEKIVRVNKVKLGCPTNTYTALYEGFGLGDFVVMVEDDVCLAPDALKYFEYCRDRYINDPEVYTISGYNRNRCVEDEYYLLLKRPAFTCWGWGTWKSRWEEAGGMNKNWDFNYQHNGWDHNLNSRLRKNRVEVYPVLSRVQNIGAEGGVHTPSPEWHAKNVWTEFWAGHESVENGVGIRALEWGKRARQG